MGDDLHRRIFDALRALPGADGLELPPRVFREMGGRFVAFDPGRRIVVEWPVKEAYAGPAGSVQGGIITAAVDNTVAPLAFLAAGGFTVTVGIAVTFVRPLPAAGRPFLVEAHLVETTRRFVFLRAEARDAGGRLIATATTEMVRTGDG